MSGGCVAVGQLRISLLAYLGNKCNLSRYKALPKGWDKKSKHVKISTSCESTRNGISLPDAAVRWPRGVVYLSTTRLQIDLLILLLLFAATL